MKKILAFVLLATSVCAFAQDNTANKYGKGLLNLVSADSSYSVKFNMRMQQLFVAETMLDGELNQGDVSTNFFTRRARLKFGGFAFSQKVTYKMELGLSNRDFGGANAATNNADKMILDAVVKWNFYKNFSLWVGQTKLPGNRERVISSQQLQFVDRSQVNSRFNIDRDQGIQLHHHFKAGEMVIKEALSISQGEGRNVVKGNVNGFDYTGRVEVLPMGNFTKKGDYSGSDLQREVSPKLAIGVTYDFNDGATHQRGQLGSDMLTPADLSTIFADLMFKYNGFSVMALYANKTANGTPLVFDKTSTLDDSYYTGSGFNFQTGYLFRNNVELAGRVTTVNPEDVTGRNDYNQFTLGLSKYVSGHNLKVQSDISLLKENGVDDELMFRLQVELAL
ncbi:MAG: phosphate-selective porin OprO/OprP [Flavobacteriales bacterium]|jgi:phosphate-selective porin OprO/OprP